MLHEIQQKLEMKSNRLQRRNAQEKKDFPCCLTLWDVENNEKTRAWFTLKGAELWYYFVGRGYCSLQWHNQSTDGYYYKLSDIKEAMQKLWNEGLTKPNGYFYQERYYL